MYVDTQLRTVPMSDSLQDEVYFRVNCDRFNVHIRNRVGFFTYLIYCYSCQLQLIEEAAGDRFNQGAAQVMQAALKATETKQLSLLDPMSGNIMWLGLRS
jgi:DNA-directed RNA polymerase III subunit RPC3